MKKIFSTILFGIIILNFIFQMVYLYIPKFKHIVSFDIAFNIFMPFNLILIGLALFNKELKCNKNLSSNAEHIENLETKILEIEKKLKELSEQ